MSGPAALVARREITERTRERSFVVSTVVTLLLVALVVIVPSATGAGGPQHFTVAAGDPQGLAVARVAARIAPSFDARVKLAPHAAVTIAGGAVHARKAPDDKLVGLLQTANRALAARARPPLALRFAQPRDPDRDRKAAIAFVATLILYAQLLVYGNWVASGVVEEKASRVVEVLLATIRPRDLLAGKIAGLGALGLAQLLVVAVFGLVAGAATGVVHVDGALVGAVALALVWFALGYLFFACAYACAGALVPRVEELQATTTPVTFVIVIALVLTIPVNSNPSGTLAHVLAFVPITAPITMPARIVQGAAPAWEVGAAVLVTLAAAAALVPLAARIYRGAVLQTGSAVKLRQAWRAAAD